MNENFNIYWLCDNYKECQKKYSTTFSEVDIVVMKKEIECLTRELTLTRRLLEEMEYINNGHKLIFTKKMFKKK